MIPNFPNFKNLHLEDKPEVQQFLDKYLPYSDYNFLSLWSHDTENEIRVSILNGNLAIRFWDHRTNRNFYSFMEDQNINQTVKLLLELAKREQLQPFLKLIPEINFNKEKVENIYNVAEDRDNFDYIFSSEELSKLIGQKYHTHRNFINRFNKNYPDATTKIISLENPATQKQIVDIFNKWAGGKKVSKEETKHELTAIKKTLENAGSFKLLCTGVYDGERMIAYMIADIDHPEYCDTHFAKADPKYQGIFYVLYNNFAKELLSLGYKYMNNEQDLGLEGLRYSKSQWNPVNFFKKYIIVSNL